MLGGSYMQKEMIAMLLAGGQGSRLGILTKKVAKPAVAFGGKYRIIDFPLSNCINSGVDTIGVLTQYQPLALNQHIGIGTPWDLDRENGGVTMLAPHVKVGEHGEWYSGTANAIYQNIDFIDRYDPEYILILSGDHIYKMDYWEMLGFHKKNKCDATLAVLEVPIEEASRFGILNTNPDMSVYQFEEKPKQPKSNLISMGIYIFNWPILKKALIESNKVNNDSDFGKHIIPALLSENRRLFAYRFDGYWKDVGTIESYWQANMELIRTLPDFNLYEEFWKIYTNIAYQKPQYTSTTAEISTSLISEGCEIHGKVTNSILGPSVIVGAGSVIEDSIIMDTCTIGDNTRIYRSIIAEDTVIGSNVAIGIGDNIVNEEKPNIYDTGITVVGEQSTIPDNVEIGKNCVILGTTTNEHYPDNKLLSGQTVVLEEVQQ